jgi:ribosome-associated protein
VWCEHIVIHGRPFLDSNTLARNIIDIVEEKQASNILLLDIHEQTSIADYFIIATIDNERQAKAIQDDLQEKLHLQQNIRPLSNSGLDGNSGGWVLLDYGDVIVHLFTEEMRHYYKLEELWSKANVVLKVL